MPEIEPEPPRRSPRTVRLQHPSGWIRQEPKNPQAHRGRLWLDENGGRLSQDALQRHWPDATLRLLRGSGLQFGAHGQPGLSPVSRIPPPGGLWPKKLPALRTFRVRSIWLITPKKQLYNPTLRKHPVFQKPARTNFVCTMMRFRRLAPMAEERIF